MFKVNGKEIYNGPETWCFGTLINRRFVLTSAFCIPRYYHYSPSGYNNDTIYVPITFNKLFPTWSSIIRVYIGVYDYIYPNADITPTTLVPVEDVIYVRHYILL